MQKIKDFKVLLIYVNSMMDNLVPVHTSLIAACLKEKGFIVDIFDTTCYRTAKIAADQKRVENLQVRPFDLKEYGVRVKQSDVCEDFYKKVVEFKPDLVGLSLVETTFDLGIRLLKKIKDLKVPSIVGGVHAIMDPEGVIQNENVDMVCIGEGEELVYELCERMLCGKGLEDVKGLWFKKNGTVIKNERRTSLSDLDRIPYMDFSMFEKERFYKPMAGKIYKMVPIEISRGCYYNCHYCCDQALNREFSDIGRWHRNKSIKRIFEEINFYIDTYSAQYLYFVSETFLAMGHARFHEFVERYSKIKLPFWFNTRPETITKEKIRLLEEIGCDRISIGVEHGNEEFRKRVLNRNYSNDAAIKAIEIVKSSKIPLSLNNIIGFPDESRDLIFDTINLIRKLNLRKKDSVSCFLLSPFKGTVLREVCVQKGYIDGDVNVKDNNVDYILKNPILTKEEILGLMRTFTAYSRLPEECFPLIRKAEKFTEEGNANFEKVRRIYSEMYFS